MADTVLIIEDDESIAELLRDYLELSGYSVIHAASGSVGMQRIKDSQPDLILLDLMLPEVDGFSILSFMGENKEIPVIIVSAKSDDMYKVKGFNLGADDYIVKPFSPAELVARVSRNIKTYKQFSQPQRKQITVGGLSIDELGRRVYVDGSEVSLTQKEFDLLLFLIQNPNTVFDKERIFEKVWGYDALSDATTVTVHIARIRDKIERTPDKPQYIETVWGAGYRFKV